MYFPAAEGLWKHLPDIFQALQRNMTQVGGAAPACRGRLLDFFMFQSTKQSFVNEPVLFAICTFVFKHKPTITSSDQRPKAAAAGISGRFVHSMLSTGLLHQSQDMF